MKNNKVLFTPLEVEYGGDGVDEVLFFDLDYLFSLSSLSNDSCNIVTIVLSQLLLEQCALARLIITSCSAKMMVKSVTWYSVYKQQEAV